MVVATTRPIGMARTTTICLVSPATAEKVKNPFGKFPTDECIVVGQVPIPLDEAWRMLGSARDRHVVQFANLQPRSDRRSLYICVDDAMCSKEIARHIAGAVFDLKVEDEERTAMAG